jgi:hypothetical protein
MDANIALVFQKQATGLLAEGPTLAIAHLALFFAERPKWAIFAGKIAQAS